MKTKKRNILLTIFLLGLLYLGIKMFIPGGNIITYPITILVVFLHELGHVLAALITGGGIHGIHIDSDGSGYAKTSGGIRSIVLAGGYIGSAIFGNILLYIGAQKPKYAQLILQFLSLLLFLTAIFLYESFESTLLLVSLGILFLVFAQKKWHHAEIVMFFGIASILYIIDDYSVGPSSDIEKFAKEVALFIPFTSLVLSLPILVWKFIWLGIVFFITYWTLRKIN